MKNQENFSSTYLQIQQNVSHITCSNKNLSTHSCLSKSCQAKSFVCQDKHCSCRANHNGHWLIETTTIVNSLLSKAIHSNIIQNFIETSFDEIIDKLSDMRESLLSWVNEQSDFIGLDLREKAFLNLIKEENTQQITGSQISKIYQNLKEKQHVMKEFNNIKECFKKEFNTLIKSSQKMDKDIRKQFQKKLYMYNEPNLRNLHLMPKRLFQGSNIVKTFQEELALTNFFKGKVLKESCLLYQATQNNFQVSLFHQNCDKISHTLILIQTEFGKKIGGFTPLMWGSSSLRGNRQNISMQTRLREREREIYRINENFQNNNRMLNSLQRRQMQMERQQRDIDRELQRRMERERERVNGGYRGYDNRNSLKTTSISGAMYDSSHQTFIFSLTNQDKFQLDNNYPPIQANRQYGPVFGLDNDLAIGKNCPSKMWGIGNIGYTYLNEKYKRNDKQSFERFTGNPDGSGKFLIKQWQAWHISFYQKKIQQKSVKQIQSEMNKQLQKNTKKVNPNEVNDFSQSDWEDEYYNQISKRMY